MRSKLAPSSPSSPAPSATSSSFVDRRSPRTRCRTSASPGRRERWSSRSSPIVGLLAFTVGAGVAIGALGNRLRADPNAAWLANRVAVDAKGFVLTGLDFPGGANPGSAVPPCRALETSRPGVFAVGDVRAGSTKRVAAAVGEGAAVVAQIHTALALQREQLPQG